MTIREDVGELAVVAVTALCAVFTAAYAVGAADLFASAGHLLGASFRWVLKQQLEHPGWFLLLLPLFFAYSFVAVCLGLACHFLAWSVVARAVAGLIAGSLLALVTLALASFALFLFSEFVQRLRRPPATHP